MTADDLKDIGVDGVGHRRKLLNAIAALSEPAAAADPAGTASRCGAHQPSVPDDVVKSGPPFTMFFRRHHDLSRLVAGTHPGHLNASEYVNI